MGSIQEQLAELQRQRATAEEAQRRQREQAALPQIRAEAGERAWMREYQKEKAAKLSEWKGILDSIGVKEVMEEAKELLDRKWKIVEVSTYKRFHSDSLLYPDANELALGI